VSSQAKIAANRANGRKSRGPRTTAGKSKVSGNAFRHGLAAISRNKPEIFAEIEPIARAICNGATNPLLFEQALIIAESGFVRCCVQAERIALIERLRDPTETALATGDLGFDRARARFAQAKLAYAALVPRQTQAPSPENTASTDPTQMQSRNGRERITTQDAGRGKLTLERDEFDAMRSAMPDLDRLERYWRRAWSRERRAIRRFMEIQSACVSDAGPSKEGAQVHDVYQIRRVSDAT
jgi:hypothetical protein